MLNQRVAIVLGSVLGAVALHLVFVACSSSSGATHAVPDAQAQTVASTPCTSWQIAYFYAPTLTPQLQAGLSGTATVPTGWEPVSGEISNISGAGVAAIVRKCVAM